MCHYNEVSPLLPGPQKRVVAKNLLQMFEGREDDLARLLVGSGVPKEDFKDDKREGLSVYYLRYYTILVTVLKTIPHG